MSDLRVFTPDAIMWVALHPAVVERDGVAAVETLFKHLVRQSNEALQQVQFAETAAARAAEAAADQQFEAGARTRSGKPCAWRVGRSPGSYGGTRRS